MEISKVMQEYLNRPKVQNLINNNQFKELFQDTIDTFGLIYSDEVFNLLDLLKTVNIVSNIEKYIPAVIRVLDKFRNMSTRLGAIFIGAKKYPWYSGKYSGQDCEIVGVNDYVDVENAVNIRTDKEVFNNLNWNIEFDDHTIIRNVPGKLLDIGSFLN